LDRSLAVSGTTLGNIQLVDWTTGCLQIAAHRGFGCDFLKVFARVKADDGSACARALNARSAIIVEDLEKDQAFPPFGRAAVLDAGVRAVQSLPLISTSGAFVGMLSTHFSAVHRPSDDERARLDSLATIAANAIVLQRARENDPIASSLARIMASRELLHRILLQEKAKSVVQGASFTAASELRPYDGA
jgi:GAF domain-containing protein